MDAKGFVVDVKATYVARIRMEFESEAEMIEFLSSDLRDQMADLIRQNLEYTDERDTMGIVVTKRKR
jgi:hypothetical protein